MRLSGQVLGPSVLVKETARSLLSLRPHGGHGKMAALRKPGGGSPDPAMLAP